jgi:hypothetical protein
MLNLLAETKDGLFPLSTDLLNLKDSIPLINKQKPMLYSILLPDIPGWTMIYSHLLLTNYQLLTVMILDKDLPQLEYTNVIKMQNTLNYKLSSKLSMLLMEKNLINTSLKTTLKT